jgi:outer membrane protein assembly factor BamB
LAFLAQAETAGAGPQSWPEFRGPWSNGHVSAPGDTAPIGLPLRWSDTENVKWKTAIPHRGWSTPVILGNQIWLTTATAEGNDFFAICVDAATGAIRFNEKLFHSDKPEPLNNPTNCYASPSPVIEPGRVYFSFGSYGTACVDTATAKVIWERHDLPCRPYRGPGSSLVLFENLLIATMDGVDVQYTAALDKATGKTVWKTDRTTDYHDLDAKGQPEREGDFRKAFSTPLIVDVNGKAQMISAGSRAVYGYDPKTGTELWKLAQADYSTASRPVYGQGIAFVSSGQGRAGLLAVRCDGQGDVSKTHLAWKTDTGAPKTTSPVLIDNLLYMVADDGGAQCLEAATGNVVWKGRVPGNFSASLIYGDGRLYASSVQGKTAVLKAGRAFEILATNTLEGGFMASPAVIGKALILRTKTHLYRIEEAK